jgi:Na+-driven multidrug efflux pump
VIGAAVATAISEISSGLAYLFLLFQRQLVQLRLLVRPPSLRSLLPLLLGGMTMLGRQFALNIGFLFANRKAQMLDPMYGIDAAAYGIVMQMTSVLCVMHIAMQSTAATLIPSVLAKSSSSTTHPIDRENDQGCGRQMAHRLFVWGTLFGLLMGMIQYYMMPYIIPWFTSIPEVRDMIYTPARIGSMINMINGPVFVGEGIMIGMKNFRDLLLITSVGISIMVLGLLSPMGQKSTHGIMISFLGFTIFQAIAVVLHYLLASPLQNKKGNRNKVKQTV